MTSENRKMGVNRLHTGARLWGQACILALILLLTGGQNRRTPADSPVVRAVLFTSPTCSHCAMVREEVLPPLAARYGPQLQIIIVSTATPEGYQLFLSASMQHALLRLSVPLLVVGNTALVGSVDIPEKFPGLIEKHIAAGGVDWPGIPGLSTMLAANGVIPPEATPPKGPPAEESAAAEPQPSETEAKPPGEPVAEMSSAPAATHREETKPALAPKPTLKPEAPKRKVSADSLPESSIVPPTPPSPQKSASAAAQPAAPVARFEPSGVIDLTGGDAQAGLVERIRRDPYGNGLAIFVLAAMLLTLVFAPIIFSKTKASSAAVSARHRDWLTPILALAGLGVAAYLSNVELRNIEAVCGPVGDCNTVQQSEYARLFSVLPIGVLGLIGFLAILAAWILRRYGSGRISNWAALGMLGMTIFGTLFSVYLTFLEPFVIGATCLWCLSSAVIMTILYVLSLNPGRRAWSAISR